MYLGVFSLELVCRVHLVAHDTEVRFYTPHAERVTRQQQPSQALLELEGYSDSEQYQ
jgi:hypothetical protein